MAQPNSSRTGPSATGGSEGSETSHSTRTNGDRQHDRTLAGRVKERATATLESQKDRATDGLGSVARAVRSTEEQLRSQHHESIAEYVAQVANQIDRVSAQLRDKRVDELVNDAQRFARRHPAAFAGSAFALGVMTARFLKSSGDQVRGDDQEYGRDSTHGSSYRERDYGDASGVGTSRPGAATTSSVYGSTGGAGAYGGSPQAGAAREVGGTRGAGEAFGGSASTPGSIPGSTPGTSSGASSAGGQKATPSTTGTPRGRRPGSETERS